MTDVTGLADWRDLEQGAPELARLGLARLHAAGVAMLGTVRPDGSPRRGWLIAAPVGADCWLRPVSRDRIGWPIRQDCLA
jgi:hypothetical protein